MIKYNMKEDLYTFLQFPSEPTPLALLFIVRILLSLTTFRGLCTRAVVKNIINRASSFKEIEPPLSTSSPPFIWFYSNVLLFTSCFFCLYSSFHSSGYFYSTSYNTPVFQLTSHGFLSMYCASPFYIPCPLFSLLRMTQGLVKMSGLFILYWISHTGFVKM